MTTNPFNETPEVKCDKHEGYAYYNYAILHNRGLHGLFDFMRYNIAHLGRLTDFQRLMEAAVDQSNVTNLFSVILVRYDSSGPTKAHWEDRRLASWQELERIDDPYMLIELNADAMELRAKPKLKWEHVCEVCGPLPWVLQVMYDNKALPHQETDANRIESAFTEAPGTNITVKLKNYMAVQNGRWTFAPKPPPVSN